MSEKKASKENNPVLPPSTKNIEIVDRNKMLTDLKIAAGFVPLLQAVLMYILEDWGGEEITRVYKNIDHHLEEGAKKKEAGQEGTLVELPHKEMMVFTLTSLITYLFEQAKKQNATIIEEGLKIEQMTEAVKAFTTGDFDKVSTEMEKLAKIMEVPTSS